MKRYAAVVLAGALVAGIAGCGSWKRVGSQDQVEPTETLTQLFDLPSFYRRIGRFSAGDPMPFVGTLAFAAAPGDSTAAVLALSLENRALTFVKGGPGFVARYQVEMALQRDSAPPIRLTTIDSVEAPDYRATQRNDESVLFQHTFAVPAGSYHVSVTVRDQVSSRKASATRDFDVPSFGPGTTTAPILVYQATGRSSLSDPVQLVLNPRGTVAYGGDTLLAYMEGYQMPAGSTVPFEVRTESDSVVFRDSLRFTGNAAVQSQIIRLRPDSMALGELKLVVGKGDQARSTSAVVSFSTAWVVTNSDDMLELLRYFGHDQLLDSVRDAPASKRSEAWRHFWAATDPNSQTPENEALDAYFTRVRIANQRFTGEGEPGWRTDRGEVYITLGEPDETYDASAVAQGRLIRWVYLRDQLQIDFTDDYGFGHFRMTPSSRAAYATVLTRHRARGS